VYNLADKSMHQTTPRADDEDHGAVAAVEIRDSDSDTSGAITRVLALHVSFVFACFAPACEYLAFVCTFISMLVLTDNPYLHACVVLVRATCVRVPCTCLRVLSLCLRVCFVLNLVRHVQLRLVSQPQE